MLAIWAGVARYSLQMDMLATATPPELQLAFDLGDRLKAFRTGADAFERAMQEATAVVEQMENAIEERRQRLSEAHDEYQRTLRLSERARRQAVMYQKLSKEQLARSWRSPQSCWRTCRPVNGDGRGCAKSPCSFLALPYRQSSTPTPSGCQSNGCSTWIDIAIEQVGARGRLDGPLQYITGRGSAPGPGS